MAARRKHEHKDMIVMALSDGAKTLAEIEENFFAFARRLGVFTPLYQHGPAVERMLQARFGQAWSEYKARVRRWI